MTRFVLLVGSGSVAASNLPGLTHIIGSRIGSPVVVALTRSAKRFVTEDTLRHLGGARQVVHDKTPSLTDRPNHIWLASDALGVLVYPASAGFIGKMASGLALDVASTTLLCCWQKPVLIVPSMNPVLWANPLVQRNISVLRDLGMQIVPTEHGVAPDVYTIAEQFAELLRSRVVLGERTDELGERTDELLVRDAG